ncbi:MAG: hypothetical protein FWE41_08060 [Coriobacteriia bacterium]|nr:hypothetical protein [Coriobacteriia bacterium]MCL2750428.1 hypothetical protein [Coriobacteriia bacterium]
MWYRRDGVGVPLFASAKSGTPTPSLLYHLLYHAAYSNGLGKCAVS